MERNIFNPVPPEKTLGSPTHQEIVRRWRGHYIVRQPVTVRHYSEAGGHPRSYGEQIQTRSGEPLPRRVCCRHMADECGGSQMAESHSRFTKFR
jgi:hypothetical protein